MKLICVGDSNTYGYDPRNFWGGRYDRPWPMVLQELAGWEIVNLGQNGRTIPTVEAEQAWLDRQIRRSLPADWIAVMLGTNDVLTAYRPSAETIAGDMEQYLRHLQSEFPGTKLLLIAPPPVQISQNGMATVSHQLNEEYRRLAQSLSIAFVDAAEWNLPLGYDGVHLTEPAHEQFAKRLAERLS